jgi:ectoine hydroxylase-related dioxygenase (phytanoyl-CoA dioxygenase family)
MAERNVGKVVSEDQIASYRRDGAVCLPGLLADWIEPIREGIERNIREPGPTYSENLNPGEAGRFFDDYCNWQRIPEFNDVIRNSPMAEAAAELMGSGFAQIFHDHVLVKESGTSKPTPWHQDAPYYFVDGEHTVSLWIPVDPVEEATLRLIAGSHEWPKLVLPSRWLAETNFYPGDHDFLPVPDPEREPEKYQVLEWPMQSGDAVAFHFRTVHGARGNLTARRRRAFSVRWVGENARYVTRPGPTSPPFTGHGMTEPQRLREDWFPVIWRETAG